jgi:predicted S18 family serine protease
MTQQDFKELLASELKLQQKTLMNFKKLMKNPEYTPEFSDITMNCTLQTIEIELYIGIDTDTLKESIKELEEKTKPHKKKLKFRSQVNLSAYEYRDHAEIDEFSLKATWYEPLSIDSQILEIKAKNICREELKKAIGEKTGIKYSYFNLDCKLVELWLEEKIDFDTLAELTTSGCKI